MIDYREDKKWTVYVHISPNNKYYVGITSQKNVNQRWKNGKGYVKNIYFFRAIQKYGWDNFEHDIIAEHLTKNEACEMEKTLIKKLYSNDYHYGYNITSGGEGVTGLIAEKNHMYGKHHSKETIEKIKETKKKNPQIYTEERKRNLSIKSKNNWKNDEYREKLSGKNAPCYGRIGEKHPMYGKTGILNVNSKQVICLDTLEVFCSATEASKIKHINHSKLCMCCRGERKTCGKDENGNLMHWKYYKDFLKENNLTDEEAHKSLFFMYEKH